MRKLFLAFLVGMAGVAAQTVPTNFTAETLVTGITQPCAMGFLHPDPAANDFRFLVTGQASGQIWCCLPDGTKTLMGTVPNVLSGSERGLLGVAAHPNFGASNPYIYIVYSATGGVGGGMRIGRYTVTGDLANPLSTNLALGSFYAIINNIPDSAFNHNGGTCRFGPDGMLYASFGDDASSCAAQTTTDGRGVILRINVDSLPAGAGGPATIGQLTPSGNPFPATASFGPLTYAYGLRNPYRFNVDATNGNLYIADVGQNAWEEFDVATVPGQNFGWPRFEGNASFQTGCTLQGTATSPMVAVSQSQGWFSAVMFGGAYHPVAGSPFSFPALYDGQVFYSDYFSGQIRRLEWNGSSWVNPAVVPGQVSATNWGQGFTALSDAVVGPDGAIYYVRQSSTYGSGPGTVGRVRYDVQSSLTIVSGNNQVLNSGWVAANPLRVQLLDSMGLPQANVAVTFTVTVGSGTLGPQPVLTDANGEASTTLTAGTLANNISVQAQAAASAPVVTFQATWRGLTIVQLGSLNIITIRHSTGNSPLTLIGDAPAAVPFLNTQWGDVWVSLGFLPTSIAVFDGLGLMGPPTPGVVTSPTNPYFYTQLVTIPTPLGITMTLQAFAVDPGLSLPEQIMISSPITLNL